MRLGYLVALAVFLLDQAAKYWIVHVIRLPDVGYIDVLPFFKLTFVGNVGVSMGLFPAGGQMGRWFLIVLTGAIATVVAWWLRRERNRLDAVALGLVLGGAIGNIVDRVRLGYVVDFLHFFWGPWSFYVFNVADAAITVGVLSLLVRSIAQPKEPGHA